MKGLNGLLIMNLTGMPLIFEELELNSSSIDPTMLSGYLQALDIFGKHNITNDPTHLSNETIIEKTSIDYGKRKILFIKLKSIKIALLFNNKISNTELIASKILTLGEKFLITFQTALLKDVVNTDIFEPFRTAILSDLICNDIPPKSIPTKIDNSLKNIITPQYIDLYNKIDGKLTIEDLAKEFSYSYEELCKILYSWWSSDILDFKNILNKEDILLLRKKGREFLSVPNPKSICTTYQEHLCPLGRLTNSDANDISCVSLLKLIDGTRSVSEINAKYSADTNINGEIVIQCLIDNVLVEPLSAEGRSILISKKLVQKFLSVMQTHLKKQDVVTIVHDVLEQIHSFEISNDIKTQGNEIIIDFNFSLYGDLSPDQLKNIDIKWMQVNYLLLDMISEKKLKKIIEDLIINLGPDFLNKFRSEDLRRFEEFNMHLESMMV